MMDIIINIFLLLLVGLIVILLFYLFRKILRLIINAVIGLIALFAVNFIFHTDIVINFWSVVITAIGGIIGFIIVLILHFAGIAF